MADRLRLEVILAAIDKATGPLKGIMGSASGASEALRKSKAALKGLRTESASIKDFSSARAELRKTTAALGEYTTKAGVSRLALDAQRAAHHQLFGEVKVARQKRRNGLHRFATKQLGHGGRLSFKR